MSVNRKTLAEVIGIDENLVNCSNCVYKNGTDPFLWCDWYGLETDGGKFCSFFDTKGPAVNEH